MSRPSLQRPMPDHHRFAAESALGPADPRTLALAAEILRERTMSLDPDESQPSKRLVLFAITATIVAAGCLILFRHQVRWVVSLLT
jgi:hypothetical protein